MARTRRRYTWTIEHDDPLMPGEVAPQVRRICEFWVQRTAGSNNNFYDPQVTGELLGTLQVSITVEARDQWQVHRKAVQFSRTVASGARVRLRQLGVPVPEKLPPHSNRGRRRVSRVPEHLDHEVDEEPGEGYDGGVGEEDGSEHVPAHASTSNGRP